MNFINKHVFGITYQVWINFNRKFHTLQNDHGEEHNSAKFLGKEKSKENQRK